MLFAKNKAMRRNIGAEASSMGFGREISIRNRVSGLFLIVTASLMVVVFVLVYVQVENDVYNHIDEELNEEAGEFVGGLQVTKDGVLFTDQAEWMERSHITVDFYPKFVQVVAAGSAPGIVRKSFNLFNDTLRYDPSLGDIAFYNSDIAGASVRQVQVPVFHGGNADAALWVVVAVPLEESLFVLSDLRTVLFFSLPVILLILFFVTRFIAGKSLAPLEQVIDTAEKITQENLDERIELPANRDELYRLSSTINDLLDRLQAAYTREKQFTADAAHELKTPLASLLGTLEVLIRKPRDPDHYKTRIELCIDELKRMSGLIDQLLLLARYDSAAFKPDIAAFDAREAVVKVLDRVEGQARGKNIDITVRNNGQAMVQVDASMLEIMLDNIVSNAVKYSERGAPVTIALENRGESVICSVTDAGPGISPEKTDRIFERFYRADESRNSQTSGTGLGLAIVKKLADIQHITLHLSSSEHEGTTVAFEMPAA